MNMLLFTAVAAAILALFPLSGVRADDCGCVGATQTFGWGDTITEDCVMNCDLQISPANLGNCFTVGTDGITIDGNGHSITSNWYYYGIEVSGRSNVTINNITIENFSEGIRIENSSGIEVSDSRIVNNIWWRGIEIVNSSSCRITRNYFERNGGNLEVGVAGGTALRVNGSGSTNNIVSHNDFNKNDRAIYVYQDASDTEISDNTVTGHRYGITVGNAPGTFLQNNLACSNVEFDIEDNAGYASGEDNTCTNTINYNDLEATGCAFGCPPTARGIYDYNGDGTSDIAVFRPGQGLWAVRGVTRAYFGSSADTPVPADYNGDGTTEIAVFRPSAGLWAVRGVTRAYFGSSADIPLPRDYTGTGTAKIAVFRPATGMWAIRGGARIYFGGSADLPVPGYYYGPAARPAIFRPAAGMWAIRGLTRVYFGRISDTPVPGDYDGSVNWTPAIFRPASGMWAVRGVTRAYFGSSADGPRPGGYRGDGFDAVGIFRPASGLWAVRGLTRAYFGGGDDIPVTR